jgi:serine/threonine-protein kinase
MNDDPRIDDLLLRWEEQRLRGEAPTAARLCSECPELLQEVEKRLRILRYWEEFLGVGRTAPGQSTPAMRAADPDVIAGETAAERPACLGFATPVERPGARIGPYRPQKLLGAGSFGEVWLAIREGGIADTRLAIKLPRSPGINLEAIRQEARLWALASNHPNIVPVFEANVYDGRVVIASEYCEEGSLADYLRVRGGGAVSPPVALDLVLGVLAGLSHLHGLGIVHRDIKPANVLLHKGVPRLADFGLSRFLSNDTLTGVPAGTPAFMAPEAFDGARSEASDVWSVGVLLYLLLAGVLPFPEREWSALFKAIVTVDPPPIPPAVPASIRDIVRMALEKDAGRRLRSAAQMSEMLRRAADGLGTLDHPVRVAAHFAVFVGTGRPALFVNVTNLSTTLDREVTHVWLEGDRGVEVTNDRRPLPRRLKPQETWETWIDIWELPPTSLAGPLYERVRVRLSTGEVIPAVENTNLPRRGFVPGGPTAPPPGGDSSPSESEGSTRPVGSAARRKRSRPWWKFW